MRVKIEPSVKPSIVLAESTPIVTVAMECHGEASDYSSYVPVGEGPPGETESSEGANPSTAEAKMASIYMGTKFEIAALARPDAVCLICKFTKEFHGKLGFSCLPPFRTTFTLVAPEPKPAKDKKSTAGEN